MPTFPLICGAVEAPLQTRRLFRYTAPFFFFREAIWVRSFAGECS